MTQGPSCACGKRPYSKTAARQIAVHLNRRDAALPGAGWNAYKCPFERKVWHLGHVPAAVPASREGQRQMALHRSTRGS